ncbi:hypothetical protein Agub_g7718 [Astrephomene gubernaculifera]|uniref:Dynein axonemal assembly factor 4 n=1 Tax=Astrephomene gubernaculifera TaxID=47775 RepID=A0AAD3HLX0_9CHLO|nr:hypothetical protein Agub_g7718 [Astrephomene gubernaculifera]
MPLTPQYTWSETEASIDVTIEVPGISRSKADVFATDAFLKVNCPPYLFALDLYKDVDDNRSSATIIPSGVVFKLYKREAGLWGVLAATGDKAALTQRRNASIDRAYAGLEEARKARLARKQQEDKDATQRSMDVDRRKRQEVERRKAEELAEERGRLEEWRAGLKDGKDAESDYEDEEEEGEQGPAPQQERGVGEAAAPDHPHYHGKGWRPSTGTGAAAAKSASAAPAAAANRGGGEEEEYDSEGADDGRQGRSRREEADEEVEEEPPAQLAPRAAPSFKPLPPPRATLQPVQVSFTKLETGHLPAREHREEEIRAFRKQATSSPAPADGDCVDLAERQPLFLKDKGDAMYRAGNYSGALNAYSRALQLDGRLPALHANRAACRLALGDAGGCVADCDRALELLAESRSRLSQGLLHGPDAVALCRQLVRLLVRRAQARVALAEGGRGAAAAGGGAGGTELLAAALRDYEDAMSLSPGDASLAADAAELAASLQPADAAALRQRGDARFRGGDYEGAAGAFGALLGLPRSRVPESERLAAFSNRAACHLVLGRYAAARADCDAGLALLLPPPQQNTHMQAGAGTAGGGGGGGGGPEFGAAAGEQGLVRLDAWARTLHLPADNTDARSSSCSNGGSGDGVEKAGEGTAAAAACAGSAGSSGGGCGLAPAAAAAAAARLLTRRGAASAHLQHFAAAAADHSAAGGLLRRLGEVARAEAAEADAGRMRALAEGREQLPAPQREQEQTAPVPLSPLPPQPETSQQDQQELSGPIVTALMQPATMQAAEQQQQGKDGLDGGSGEVVGAQVQEEGTARQRREEEQDASGEQGKEQGGGGALGGGLRSRAEMAAAAAAAVSAVSLLEEVDD